MSIDYKGQRGTGLLSKVTNTVNGKKYNVSTIRNAAGVWETGVFKQGLFGAFRPLLIENARDERQAREAHDRMENTAEQSDPARW